MREDDELRRELAEAAPVYGGSWDGAIRDAYRAVAEREPFRYSLDGDALYRQYRDRYLQNAQRAMRDTMGRAAALTGGYGSSYAQGAGQQAYDESLRGLSDQAARLEQNAYERWRDEGDALAETYGMLRELGEAERRTVQDERDWEQRQREYEDERNRYADTQRREEYSALSAAILRAGYEPDTAELAAAGMSARQAEALRQAWIASNPAAAYLRGSLSAADYQRLTGKAAPGAAATAAVGSDTGGGGGGGSRSAASPGDKLLAAARKLQSQGASDAEVNSFLLHNFDSYGATADEVRSIRGTLGTAGARK